MEQSASVTGRATGRLAPTPSGDLHLGNALAFGAAWLSAREAGGRLLLRIEDLDRGRARADVAERQREDLRWLGIGWDAEVPPQSARAYSVDGLPVYRCDCPRSARLAGACRCDGLPKTAGAWVFRAPPEPVDFLDLAQGPQRHPPERDPILIRADGEPAYPLAVVVDDHRDGVTEVVRGADLLPATAVQLLLHRALGIRPPTYLHVPLLMGPDGRKLGKSHGSTELRALRARGWTPDDVWALLLPLLGLPPGPLAQARFDPAKVPPGPFRVEEHGASVAVRPW
jgi:glutamyl/glutaminyl-tRNA synthetase